MACEVVIIDMLDWLSSRRLPIQFMLLLKHKDQQTTSLVSTGTTKTPDRASIQPSINIQDAGGGQQPDTVGV